MLVFATSANHHHQKIAHSALIKGGVRLGGTKHQPYNKGKVMSKQVMNLEAQLAAMRATMATLQAQMDALQAQVARADSVEREPEQESAQEQVMDDVALDEMEDGENEASFDDTDSSSGSESDDRTMATEKESAKWNGWADAFLLASQGTPFNVGGLRDTYVSGTVKLPYDIPLNVTYHHFTTDIGGTDLGDEIDVTVTKKLTKNLSTLARFAHFDGTSTGPADRDKFWLQFDYKF